MANEEDFDNFDFIRTIAVARIMMPKSYVRLSAGRETMNEEMHALVYFAGANSIFYGEKLLTTPNPQANKDLNLFERLGILPEGKQIDPTQLAEESAKDKSVLFYNAASNLAFSLFIPIRLTNDSLDR